MKKIILPVILLAIGAGIAAAASFAARQGDCCQAAKHCCEAKGDCCKGVPAAADEKVISIHTAPSGGFAISLK